jgi:chromate transporter
MPRPSLSQFARVFFRVGNTTFGGGLLTMGVLGRELVDRQHWIAPEDYELAFALARVTPGASIIAFCAAVGWLILGWAGALLAVLALTAPSAILAVLLLQGIEAGAGHPLVMGVVAATVAAVSGMMWALVWIIIRPFAKGFESVLRSVSIAGGAFLLSWKFNVTPVPVLVAATLASLLWGWLSKNAARDAAKDAAKP